MKLQTKFLWMLIFISSITGVGIIIPGYFKIRDLELHEASDYSERVAIHMQQDIDRSHEILKKAGVLEIESYLSSSKEELIERFKKKPPDPRVNSFILETDGSFLLSKTNAATLSITPELARFMEQKGTGNLIHDDGSEKWHIEFQNNNIWGWILVTGMSDREVYKQSRTYLEFVLSISLIVLVLVIAIYLILTGQVRRKLGLILGYLNRYSAGHLDKRLEVTSTDEIGVLQRSINSMIENIEIEIDRREKTESALEEARSEAEKANQAKTEFLANMSHEIRNPLNATIGYLEILSKTNLDEKQLSYITNIAHASQNLTATLNDILDLAKIESGTLELTPEFFGFHEEITSAFNLFSLSGTKKGVEMNCRIREQVPKILYGDKPRCVQIVTNLVNNAVKFTSAGSINLDVTLDQETSSSYILKLEIRDTGKGIHEDEQKNVFSVFRQTKAANKPGAEGVGLGLAIVKRAVELMDGTIELESSIGRGSTFTILLPFKKIDPSSFSSVDFKPLNLKSLSTIKVLITDDDLLNREYISEILRNNEIAFITAKSGEEAIEHLENEAIDVVLMDIRMPGMNGDEAVQHIRQNSRESINKVPIIVLTANAFKEDVKRYLDIGATSCLTKPFDSNTLLNTVQQALSPAPCTGNNQNCYKCFK